MVKDLGGIPHSLSAYHSQNMHVRAGMCPPLIGPHPYSEQVLTVDSGRKCDAVRFSLCKPKPKITALSQANILP